MSPATLYAVPEEPKTVRGKRRDPRYGQLIGDVPKDIIQEFKINCVKRNLNIGEALTEAVLLWNQEQNKTSDHRST